MKPSQIYSWVIITHDGEEITQIDGTGNEVNTWKSVRIESIARIVFKPNIDILPVHTISFKGNAFVRMFRRGIIKQRDKIFCLQHYFNCVVTEQFKFWLEHTGRVHITPPDWEIYP